MLLVGFHGRRFVTPRHRRGRDRCVPGLVVVLLRRTTKRPSAQTTLDVATDGPKPLQPDRWKRLFDFMAQIPHPPSAPSSPRPRWPSCARARDRAAGGRPGRVAARHGRRPRCGRRARGPDRAGHRDVPRRSGRAGTSGALRTSAAAAGAGMARRRRVCRYRVGRLARAAWCAANERRAADRLAP